MSARKSFDVARPRAQTAASRTRKVAVKRKKASTPSPRRAQSLKARRAEARNRAALLGILGIGLAIGLLVYGLWRPEVRIAHITVSGIGAEESVRVLAKEELSGAYALVVPRDSFFFYDEQAVRTRILDTYPDLAGVSISRTGLTSVAIRGTARAQAFLWCGTERLSLDAPCYHADSNGLIFAQAPFTTATTSMLRVYSPLSGTTTAAYPLRMHLIGSEKLPGIIRLAKGVTALGVSLTALQLRSDEVDLFTTEGVRITYILGHEQAAIKNATAALPKLSLTDGSVEYIDLRFDGKVYVKRVGEE